MAISAITTSFRLAPAESRALEEALARLANVEPPADELWERALRGSDAWARELLDRLRDHALSAPLAELAKQDNEEWWQVEALRKERDQQLAVLAALLEPERIIAATRSAAYATHRALVEEKLALTLPEVALIVASDPSTDGDFLNGWLPPHYEEPWALVLTHDLTEGGINPTLVHELVHLTQGPPGSPVADNKELEWVLGVGHEILIEGAAETLVAEIIPGHERAVYSTQTKTFARLASHLRQTPLALARRVSASSYPLGEIAELDNTDDETLAWEILVEHVEELDRRDATPP